ncbi:MAG: hypothetical protein IJW30_05110 [Clostridia bacterium]|nr:hypothetical protein [Clostridia bacterium]
MKIRKSSRITAIVLALMMIVPLISIPTMAADKSTSIDTNTDVSTPVYSEDFNEGTTSDLLSQYPYASDIVYGVGDSDSMSLKVEQKATWKTELAVLYTDRTGAMEVTAVEYADGRAWTGIANYDGSEVVVTGDGVTGITGVITTVAKATNAVSSCTVVTDVGAYTGSKTLAIVEGPVANAIAGNCGKTTATIAREAYAKNPAITMTEEKVFVLEADYYVSADFSTTIEGRVYGDAGQIDLFRIVPSGNNVKICKHTDCVDVKNGENGVTVPKGNWYNLKFVIDATTGYPTVHCFVNDAFAFTVNESTNLAGKTLTTLNANRWNFGHASRGIKASTLTGYWAVDNANIYTSTAGMKLNLWSNDVDSASQIGDIFNHYVPGGRIAIDSTTFADTEHGSVVAWDNTPYADGNYWLYTGSGHFGANNNNKITDITVTDGKATGSVTVSGTTYYFKDATVCTTSRTQTKATMYTDADCTTAASVTYYICDGAVATAYTGGCGGNIAQPSRIVPGLTGQKFTVSADYNFGTDLVARGMDIRLMSPNVHMFSIGSTTASANTITVSLHSDLSNATNVAKGNVVYTNNTLTISKGEWHNFTVTFDSTSDTAGTLITGYVDGRLVGSIFMANAEMTQIDWNVGHTTRNGAPANNKGHWYMDNFAIYYGNVIPEAWTAEDDSTVIYEEDFELLGTKANGSNIYYAGTLYDIADVNGNKAFKIDSNTYVDGVEYTSNIDQNLFAKNPAIDAATYDSVVFESAYYLDPGSYQYIEAQFRKVDATYSTTFGTEGTSTGTANFVQLYTIRQLGDHAYFNNLGSSNENATAHTTTYNTSVPTGRWFTVSSVLNVDTGAISFYVDGVLYAETYLYGTSGVTGFLTNLTVQAGGSGNGFIVAKLNTIRKTDRDGDGTKDDHWGYATSGLLANGYTGFFMVDDIKVYTGTAPKNLTNSVSIDYEDAALADGNKVLSAYATSASASNKAPTQAIYTDELAGNWAVKFSMKGETEETTLDVPFLAGFNTRAYDLKVTSDGSWTPVASGKVTWDMIEGDAAVLTKTGSLNGTNDKPLYYYWDGSETVHVYNNGGTAVTESTVGKLTYSKVTLTDANYNAMFRSMCGGLDANIDRNYTVNNPVLSANGTYVISADYYVPEDASGIAQAQLYSDWTDLYRLDLTNKTFNVANSTTVAADIIVNEWNNMTAIVTIADGTAAKFDIYWNGVYTHTVSTKSASHDSVLANEIIFFKASKPANLDIASAYNGNVYLDNVQINAVAYDETAIVEVDTTNATGIGVDGNPVVTVTAASTKIYTTKGYGLELADVTFDYYTDMISTELMASIRLGDPTGLRFATLINTDKIDALAEMVNSGEIKAVEFGTLIAPMDDGYMGSAGKELTLEDLVVGETVLKVVADAGQYFEADEDAATTHYVGSIVNIHETNMDRAFSGRGYVSITMANGTVYNIYSETIMEISVADQAQKTIDAGIYTEDSAEGIILAGFAAYNVAE